MMNICPVFNYSQNVYPVSVKSAVTPAFGNKKLLTQPIIDCCSFTHTDKSLSPKFLKSLVEIYKKNTGSLQNITIIKDKLLKAMGYKHPEALKVNFRSEGAPMGYVVELGQLMINMELFKQCSAEFFIAALRHEMEHFDQYVKIYKTKGKEAFLEGLTACFKKNYPDKKGSYIASLRDIFNSNFYEIMSNDISAEGFDSDKYYMAMRKAMIFNVGLSEAYKYQNNLLEKDAYEVTKKVLKALEKDPVTAVDTFPANYKKLIKLLKDNGIPKQYYDGQLQMLYLSAEVKNIETPENYKRFVKIYNNIATTAQVSCEDMTWFNEMIDKVSKPYLKGLTLEAVQTCQKCYQQVETWLSEGKFTAEDILTDM